MKIKILCVVSGVAFLAWAVVRFSMSEQFHQQCGDHLLNAAAADSIEVAEQELQAAVTYIDNEILTSESRRSKEMADWANGLRVNLRDLKRINPEAAEYKKSRALARLNQSLLVEVYDINRVALGGHHHRNKAVTVPRGVSVHPYNTAFSIWGFGSGAILFITFIWLLIRRLQRW